MNYYKSSAELKNMAKEKLEGNYGMVIALFVITVLINFAVSELSAFLFPSTTAGYILSLAVSLLASIIIGVMNVGICLFFLNIACGQPFTVNDLFYGYRNQSNKCLAISLVFSLLQFVCLTPYQVMSMLYLRTGAVSWAILMFFSMALGLLIYVPLSLGISQSFYLILDFPDLNALDTLQKSIKVMKGHKGRLFYIQASFIPLFILSIFTCCIGFLWVVPYLHMTMTCFFLDLMNPSKKPGS